REALTLEDVMATLNSKEIKERSKAKGDDSEGLYVRGRTDRRDSRQSRGKSRSKSRGGRLKCYIFQSEDHLKRNFLKNNRKKSSGYVNKDDQPSSSGSIYDGFEVMMVMSAEALLDWIMDSGGAGYCWVTIGSARSESGKIKVINDSRIVLSGTRRDNCVYSLDGHTVAGELNASIEEKDSLAQVWHKRLGYIREAGLQVLEKQGLFGKKSLDEASEVIISFIKKTQVNLQLQVQRVRTDNGTETPQQNGVVERRNRTLVEAARTMLTFANLPSFLWAEAIATACFTQNRSIICKRFDKTPYELINKRKPNIKFFRVFGCQCYLLSDYEDVGKLKAKGDIGVFVGYSKESAFRIYNKRTRKIHESVNVNFDDILEMASKQFSLEPSLSKLNETAKSLNPSVLKVSEASKKDLEDLFQDFYDEYFDSSKIMKSSTTNVETSIAKIPSHGDEVFHEVSESFQGESSSSSLND
nr:retrovirus-related Pol polyprotein from transposon TNT 1-94 [Tanacetum cinerariifolium]